MTLYHLRVLNVQVRRGLGLRGVIGVEDPLVVLVLAQSRPILLVRYLQMALRYLCPHRGLEVVEEDRDHCVVMVCVDMCLPLCDC